MGKACNFTLDSLDRVGLLSSCVLSRPKSVFWGHISGGDSSSLSICSGLFPGDVNLESPLCIVTSLDFEGYHYSVTIHYYCIFYLD